MTSTSKSSETEDDRAGEDLFTFEMDMPAAGVHMCDEPTKAVVILTGGDGRILRIHFNKPSRLFETQWNCDTEPKTYYLQLSEELWDHLVMLKCANADLKSIQSARLIFTFGHETREYAFKKIINNKDVKETLTKFLKKVDSNVRVIKIDGKCLSLSEGAAVEHNMSTENPQEEKNKDIPQRFERDHRDNVSESSNTVKKVSTSMTGIQGNANVTSSNVAGLQINKGDTYNITLYMSDWSVTGIPEQVASKVCDLCSEDLASLKDIIKKCFNADLKDITRGSLIFLFTHKSRGDALNMVINHKQVKGHLLHFLRKLDAEVTDIKMQVRLSHPSRLHQCHTRVQMKLANLKKRYTALKREVDSIKGQIYALENDDWQRRINFLFEEMDVLRLFSVKIKRLMTELDRKKKALRHPPVDDLSPVCCGRDLLAIRMKPQLMEFKQRILGQEDVLDSIKEFLVGDKIHIGYLQTKIDSRIMKQRRPDSRIMKQRRPVHYDEEYDDDDDDDDDDVYEGVFEAIKLERDLERVTQQLQVKMERNSERDVEEIPANLVDVDKGDDSVMKSHVDVPQAAPSAPTPRSVSPLLSQQNISEGRVRSFLPQSNQCKDSDSGDKEKDVTKTGDVRQMSIQFQDMMKRAEDMDESHSSHFDEPSISKGTLSDDYTASQERDMRTAETQICIAEIAEQEKRLLTLEKEHDLQKRQLDSLYCDLPDEWLIKVSYLQRHQDVLSLYDVELPEVISEMVRPGSSHIQTAKLEISPEDESHKRPVKRSQISKLRRFQQGLLKESDLFDIIGNMIVDDEDHLASLQALNGPVYLVGPSSLQVVCPKLHLDAARANTRFCLVTTDGELVNSRPDTRSRDRRRLQKYSGTCASTPIPLSPPHPTLTPVYNTPRYWETRTRVRLVERMPWYVLEMGVCEAGQVDSAECVCVQRRSWCVRVESCDRHGECLCTRVWREAKRGESHQNTMSRTPGTQATLHYGMVLDVGRGRISFIDLNRGIVIGKYNERFMEDLYPVLGVSSLTDDYTVNMELISGDNIAITDTKMSLIHDALT